MLLQSFNLFTSAYANDVDALKPEWWAFESLAVLEEQLVVANLVNRDYDNYFVNAGDTVHVNKPGTFTASHKVMGSNTTLQDATATDDTVKLNQHLEVTFSLDDREMQLSMPDLRSYFLVPAIRAIAEGIDGAIVGEGINFRAYCAGRLGTALDDDAIIDLGKTMDDNYVPTMNRNLIVGPAGKADLLKIDRYADADKSGQASKFLSGQIGSVMGFDVFMSQTVGAPLATAVTTTSETINNGSLAIGTTTLTIDAAGAAHTKGTALTIAGVDGIYVLGTAIGGGGTSCVLETGLRSAAADGAAITFYESDGVVDNAANYAAGSISIITDGYTAATEIPQVGQSVSFGAPTASTWYTVQKVSGTYVDATTDITLELNRPLDVGITDGDALNVGPTGGSKNVAFRPDAITLVNRPLAPATAGVNAATQNNGQMAIRVTMGYDYRLMKHFITVDTLLGVKTLDALQGALLLN